MFKIAFYTTLLLFSIIGNTEDNNRILIIPDQFTIKEVFGHPQFAIIELLNGEHQVKISYQINTEGLEKYLYQQYENDLKYYKVYTAEAMPFKINHLSTLFDDKNIVTWTVSLQTNEIHLNYHFTNELSFDDINKIFKFNFLYATVDFAVLCEGQIGGDRCFKTIENIPLFNQYRLMESEELRLQYEELYQLIHYTSITRLGFPILQLNTMEDVDSYLSENFFDTQNDCLSSLNSKQLQICSLIKKHSDTTSIIISINKIKDQLFNEFNVDLNREFYILSYMDFEAISSEQ